MFVQQIPDIPEKSVCDIHGEYEHKYTRLGEKFIVMNKCSKCSEIAEAERQAEEKKQKQIAEEKFYKDRKLNSGISLRHIDCSFSNYKAVSPEQKKALQQVSDYSDALMGETSACLVMAGSVGTGKTHLASAVANRFIESGRKCMVIKMSELIRSIKDTWRKDSDVSEARMMDRLSKVGLLVIDEIGIQFGSDTEKLLISEIIDNRYQNLLPTVLISNLDLAGIKSCIGERSYDRLREDGGKVVAFNWESHRGVK